MTDLLFDISFWATDYRSFNKVYEHGKDLFEVHNGIYEFKIKDRADFLKRKKGSVKECLSLINELSNTILLMDESSILIGGLDYKEEMDSVIHYTGRTDSYEMEEKYDVLTKVAKKIALKFIEYGFTDEEVEDAYFYEGQKYYSANQVKFDECNRFIRVVPREPIWMNYTWDCASTIIPTKPSLLYDFTIDYLTSRVLDTKSKWKSESTMFYILNKIFKDDDIIYHYRPRMMEGLELDAFVSNKNIAFEYQGQQHFKYIPYFHTGGIHDFEEQCERDAKKKYLCEQNKIKLIYIKYDDPLTISFIQGLINSN